MFKSSEYVKFFIQCVHCSLMTTLHHFEEMRMMVQLFKYWTCSWPLLCLMLYSLRLFQHICPHEHMLTILLITLPSYSHLKHTPPHFHHMLKGKFEAEKKQWSLPNYQIQC